MSIQALDCRGAHPHNFDCYRDPSPEELLAALNPDRQTVVVVGRWVIVSLSEWRYVLGEED